jgi:type II secretory ATPase GspE/PulE/Tfp pilus assembly ATPase PilB-like protein
MKTHKDNEVPDFVDRIFSGALKLKASDIYWLPMKDGYNIRFRINGLQQDREKVSLELGDQCVNRIKVISGLLTYRTKIAQDGVIRGIADFADAELRVAAMPTINGERISIRVLYRSGINACLEDLNLTADLLSAIRKMLIPASGLIILTGPTGCGKTTTIYAMIRDLLRNSQDPASIITVEDPVECEIDGISQISLTRCGEDWGYPEALRAALRQDVKTLVIGEMRDSSVVKVALDAALTGHRVITTFHAGDIPSVYARMLHQGFEPFLVASAITGVIAQRLVQSAKGEGRIPVAAYLNPNDEWKDFIISNPGLRDLRRKITEYPDADVKQAAAKMAGAGLIHEKDVYLL